MRIDLDELMKDLDALPPLVVEIVSQGETIKSRPLTLEDLKTLDEPGEAEELRVKLLSMFYASSIPRCLEPFEAQPRDITEAVEWRIGMPEPSPEAQELQARHIWLLRILTLYQVIYTALASEFSLNRKLEISRARIREACDAQRGRGN